MKNIATFKYMIIILSINSFITTSVLNAGEQCDYYNQQFDKYSQLADATPDATRKKLEYIKKMDYYDMKIFHDDSCDLRETKKFIDTDIINNLLDNL